MPFKRGDNPNPKGGKIGNAGGTGRPPNWFRMGCKEVSARIDLPEFWAKIVMDPKERTSDRMEAAKTLAEFGEGKASQSLEITNKDESSRISTDVLLQTITALRAELDSLRTGTGMAERK